MRRLLRQGWLALSGWIALACTALPAPDALRAVPTVAFLLVCPGLALVRLVQPLTERRGRPLDALERATLSVALSLALDVLVAEAFFLARAFTVTRATAALALLVTLLVLLTAYLDRRRQPARRHRKEAADGGARPDARMRRAAGLATVGVLALTTACGGSAATPIGLPSPQSPQPTPTADLSAPSAPGPWKQVFGDDFLGTGLNHADWATCYDWNNGGCTNAGNHELQWYLPGQVTVADGEAKLLAQRRNTTGADGKVYPWTSGMITTGRDSWDAAPRHTFTYGYFAAALQVPDDDTMFPAFWLLPESRTVPPELDIAEFISDARSVQMTVHWAGPDGRDTHQDDRYGPVDFPSGFHVFAVDWEPASLTWYVDGVERYRVTDREKIPNVPMEVLVNLAVGYPTPPPPGVDSATLKVDWVRVWQRPS